MDIDADMDMDANLDADTGFHIRDESVNSDDSLGEAVLESLEAHEKSKRIAHQTTQSQASSNASMDATRVPGRGGVPVTVPRIPTNSIGEQSKAPNQRQKEVHQHRQQDIVASARSTKTYRPPSGRYPVYRSRAEAAALEGDDTSTDDEDLYNHNQRTATDTRDRVGLAESKALLDEEYERRLKSYEDISGQVSSDDEETVLGLRASLTGPASGLNASTTGAGGTSQRAAVVTGPLSRRRSSDVERMPVEGTTSGRNGSPASNSAAPSTRDLRLSASKPVLRGQASSAQLSPAVSAGTAASSAAASNSALVIPPPTIPAFASPAAVAAALAGIPPRPPSQGRPPSSLGVPPAQPPVRSGSASLSRNSIHRLQPDNASIASSGDSSSLGARSLITAHQDELVSGYRPRSMSRDRAYSKQYERQIGSQVSPAKSVLGGTPVGEVSKAKPPPDPETAAALARERARSALKKLREQQILPAFSTPAALASAAAMQDPVAPSGRPPSAPKSRPVSRQFSEQAQVQPPPPPPLLRPINAQPTIIGSNPPERRPPSSHADSSRTGIPSASSLQSIYRQQQRVDQKPVESVSVQSQQPRPSSAATAANNPPTRQFSSANGFPSVADYVSIGQFTKASGQATSNNGSITHRLMMEEQALLESLQKIDIKLTALAPRIGESTSKVSRSDVPVRR